MSAEDASEPMKVESDDDEKQNEDNREITERIESLQREKRLVDQKVADARNKILELQFQPARIKKVMQAESTIGKVRY